ncbi:MAG: hypothetical protein IT303_05415 [Dehalococcoidia bacterium]|nr:hypothetical protein [Dehalococcoidia bacterium]
MSLTRRFNVATLLALAAVLAALVVQGRAFADPTVPTTGEVTSSGVAPYIECSWALPDINDDAGDGMQYGDDDDPATGPDPSYPCDMADSGRPGMADGATGLIQVLPNAHDEPTEKSVELWAAVDHENGISNIDDVYWKVFHPDGSFKVQVHGVSEECTGPEGMFGAATTTGQVTSVAINDVNNGIIALCQQGVKAIYSATFDISKHQPSGDYRIETYAVADGNQSMMTSYIYVVPFYNLVTDFTTVSYGTISPGLTKIVAGDLVMGTADRPTIQNTGNSGMGIGVRFSPMLQQDVSGPKEIVQFDARFGRSPSTLQTIDPIYAGELAEFDDDPARVLCPNRIGKIDFSVHPPSTLPAGQYAGDVEIVARSAPYCLTDDGSVSPLTVEDPVAAP